MLPRASKIKTIGGKKYVQERSVKGCKYVSSEGISGGQKHALHIEIGDGTVAHRGMFNM